MHPFWTAYFLLKTLHVSLHTAVFWYGSLCRYDLTCLALVVFVVVVVLCAISALIFLKRLFMTCFLWSWRWPNFWFLYRCFLLWFLDFVTVRSWGRTHILTIHRGWSWYFIVSVLNSLKKYKRQRNCEGPGQTFSTFDGWKSELVFVRQLVTHSGSSIILDIDTQYFDRPLQSFTPRRPDKN